jgi:type 1 glutamine amidotransferase
MTTILKDIRSRAFILVLICSGLFFGCGAGTRLSPAPAKPLRVLLITGGCCHNYDFQAGQLTNAVNKRGLVEWTVMKDGGTGTKAMLAFYDNPNWAKGYDLVVHNECFADTDDAAYISKITEAHKRGKIPALVIHCAMHTYRASKSDEWREFLGVTSRRHDEKQGRFPVTVVAKDHPVMAGFPERWVTPMDEIYIIEKFWPRSKALATAVSEKSGEVQPVMWVNDYYGARVFGTTFGHSDATFSDPVFNDTLARAVFWAVKK